MTRKQTKAAILAAIRKAASAWHLEGLEPFAILHYLGHEAERQPRGPRWRPASQHGRGAWLATPHLSGNLTDLLRTMRDEHGRELDAVHRSRGDYVATVIMDRFPKSPFKAFRHADLALAILGAFLLSVD